MTRAEPGRPAGLWAPLSSLVGRRREVGELSGLLRERRLVTVTGPGGVGKTRLAVEIARAAAGQFPDGVHFVGLGSVQDPARVQEEVAAALGVRQTHGRPLEEVLSEVLAPRRLLIVLDNCEHVLTAVAELCGALLKAADELHILATSREQLWVGEETRYRLSPLGLPRSDDPADVSQSEAVALFADRARRADSRFVLGPDQAPLAARVVTRLDGMPLAIELAAARVEALGLAGLADRIDDALQLLNGRGPLTDSRHKSLAAVADWSYRLLPAQEQRVFRRLGVFPGPFTMQAAEAVAGPDAEATVLRLVDCSLLAPPRRGPDGRMRYSMLQTLRAYGLGRLDESGEEPEAAARLAGYALSVAELAAAGLETRDGERDALLWLDAEDATAAWALGWTAEHRPDDAIALAAAMGPWWRLHGRAVEGYSRLAAAVRTAPAGRAWAKAQLWLGYLSPHRHLDGALAHYTAAAEAGDDREAADALVARAFRRYWHGQAVEADGDVRRALALSRTADYAAGEAQALAVLSVLSVGSSDAGTRAGALEQVRQAQEALSADVPGWLARWCQATLAHVLIEAGELEAARRSCADGLAQSRSIGDLTGLINVLGLAANLEWLAGRMADVRGYVREAADISSAIGDHTSLLACMDQCALVCAATGRWTDAITLWGSLDAQTPGAAGDDRELRRQASQALEPGQVREAAERGARMTLAAAAEFVVMLTERPDARTPEVAGGGKALTERERELITLVAQGRTNAQIAAQLFISIRTVSSHLDRIRDKTGSRRRADLTRLAIDEGLV